MEGAGAVEGEADEEEGLGFDASICRNLASIMAIFSWVLRARKKNFPKSQQPSKDGGRKVSADLRIASPTRSDHTGFEQAQGGRSAALHHPSPMFPAR